MRRALILLPVLLLAACNEEPDFNARYDETAKEIEARAKAMDGDLTAADKAASAQGAADAGAKTTPSALPSPAKPSNPPSSSGE